MAYDTWQFDASEWPVTFGAKWMWTIFAEPKHHERVVKLCVDLGITDLAILCNDSPVAQPEFAIRTGAGNVVKLSKLAQAAGVRVHLGTWLDPKIAYVEACAVGMAKLAKESGAASIILDLEGEWNKRITNHTAFVASTVAPAFDGFPTPIGITSFAILPKSVVPALAWAVKYHDGYGQPQAYSVYQGKKWQRSELIQPDRLSSTAWRTWSPLTRRLVCLEAAYGNPVPGRRIVDGEWQGKAWGVGESIRTAAQRAKFDGFPSIGWWTEESFAGGSMASKERAAAISEIETSDDSLVEGGWGWPTIGGAILAGLAIVGTAFGLLRGRK